MRLMGDDRSDLAEPMHRPYVDLGVRRIFPCRLEVGDYVSGGETCSATVVDIHPVGRRRGELAPVEPGVSHSDDGPRLRVVGGFACGIARFELGDSRVE